MTYYAQLSLVGYDYFVSPMPSEKLRTLSATCRYETGGRSESGSGTWEEAAAKCQDRSVEQPSGKEKMGGAAEKAEQIHMRVV